MNKILINVYVPVLNSAYDFFVPVQLQVFEVTELIKRAVVELSEGRFIPSYDTALAYRETGDVCDINDVVFESRIKNGTKLMLV